MQTRPDYYLILGIAPHATPAEVRSAYRRAARAHHPDLNPGDVGAADRFKRVQQAYEVLSDPVRRATYRRPPSGHGAAVGNTADRARGRTSARSSRPASPDDSLTPEVVEAISLLRALAEEMELERRVRRFVRFLERL